MTNYLQTFLSTILWGAGGLAATVLILLVTFQEKLVYVPVIPGVSKEYPFTPQRLRMNYEDVWLTAADGVKLHAWFIKHEPEVDGPTMLFFQENAGNIAHRLESIDLLMKRLHCNVFMLSYRGYGASEGSPSQRGIILDAQASLDHLQSRGDIHPRRIVVFGRSLGGAVGAKLVYDNPRKVAGLIVENTFTSILDMAGKMMPWLKGALGSHSFRPLNFLVRSQWRTIDIIGQIKEPILFLSGLMDEMVPPVHMQLLYARALANPKCKFVEFRYGMHMDTWLRGGERYWTEISAFLEEHASSRCLEEIDEGEQSCSESSELLQKQSASS